MQMKEILAYLHDLEDEGRILKVVLEAEVDLSDVLGRF